MGQHPALDDNFFLLDTNVLSAVIKNPDGKIGLRLREIPQERLATSIIVSCELRFGAEKKASARIAEQVNSLLRALQILPLDEGIDHVYAKTRTAMEKSGHSISSHDLLIASQAIFFKATLVTENRREFARVPGLEMQSWG